MRGKVARLWSYTDSVVGVCLGFPPGVVLGMVLMYLALRDQL